MRPAKEMLDVVDAATGRPTGEVVSREVAHRDGIWHATFHLWVVRRGRPDLVLLQERGARCAIAPGKLDVTVGGHLRAGETVEMGVREAEEEIGLSLVLADLVPLGRHRLELDDSNGIEREVVHVFLHATTTPIESFRPAPAEVAGLHEVPLSGLIDVLAGAAPSCPRRGITWRGASLEPVEGIVRRADVVVGRGDYPLDLLGRILESLRSG
jgi:isopentenyldiphosphate isomerase